MTVIPPTFHRRFTLGGILILLAVLATAVTVALATGDGTPSWNRTVAVSGGICGLGALSGWLIARRPHTTPAVAVARGLAAVGIRLVGPLAALAWLQTAGRGAGHGDGERLLVAFYLLLLATDIVLNILWATKTRGERRPKTAN